MASNIALAFIAALDATVERRLEEHLGDRVVVTNFKNADDTPVLGNWNGTTGRDNTTGIQAAIDVALVSGAGNARPLYFPPGNYRTTEPLIISGTVGGRVEGAGKLATTITYTGPGDLGNPLASTTHIDAGDSALITPVFLLDRVEQTRFQDFGISGTDANRTETDSRTTGFFCYQGPYEPPYTVPPGSNICSQCTFLNMDVRNFYDNGFNFGIGFNCENMILIGVDITQCDFAGVFAASYNSLNHIVIGGHIENCGARGTYEPFSGVGGGFGGGLIASIGTFLFIAGVSFKDNYMDVYAGLSNCNIIGGRTEGVTKVSIASQGASINVDGFTYRGPTTSMFLNSGGGPIATSSCLYDPPSNTGGSTFARAATSIIFDNFVMSSTAKSAGVINVDIALNYSTSQVIFRNCDFAGSPLPPDIGSYHVAPFTEVTCRAVTVAELPTASATWKGVRLVVSNHTGAVAFGGTPTAGGTTAVPVFCSGAAWKIGG